MTKAQQFLRDGLCLAVITAGMALLFGSIYWVIMHPDLSWATACKSMVVMAIGGIITISGIVGLLS